MPEQPEQQEEQLLDNSPPSEALENNGFLSRMVSWLFGRVSPNELPSDKDNKQYLIRWIELGNSRFLGQFVSWAFAWRDYHKTNLSPADVEFRTQWENLGGNVGGLLLSILCHYLCKKAYRKNRSPNPLYRNFKTLASAGTILGNTLANIIPVPLGHSQKILNTICVDVAGLLIGALAIPIWAIDRFSKKEYELKLGYNEEPKDEKINTEELYLYVENDSLYCKGINQAGEMKTVKLTQAHFDKIQESKSYQSIKETLLEVSGALDLEESHIAAFFKIAPNCGFGQRIQESNSRTGAEGWSKYAKTFLVYGANLGQVLGAIYAYFNGADILLSMALFGGLTAVAAFVGSIALVPAINRYYNKALISDGKDTFRNNYIRTGITLGASLGSVLGFFAGTFLYPAIGPALAMGIGAALGSVVMGATLGRFGSYMVHAVHGQWRKQKPCSFYILDAVPKDPAAFAKQSQFSAFIKVNKKLFYFDKEKKEINTLRMASYNVEEFIKLSNRILPSAQLNRYKEKLELSDLQNFGHLSGFIHNDSENGIDYATRGMSYVFANFFYAAFFGAIVGLNIAVPGGIFVGAALGSSIGSVFGWFAGLKVVQVARSLQPIEEKSESLPWTQRIATGSILGGVLGSALGFGIGLTAGPAGMAVGSSLGFSIGGFLGSVAGAFYERVARNLFYQYFGLNYRELPPAKNEVQLPESIATTPKLVCSPKAEQTVSEKIELKIEAPEQDIDTFVPPAPPNSPIIPIPGTPPTLAYLNLDNAPESPQVIAGTSPIETTVSTGTPPIMIEVNAIRKEGTPRAPFSPFSSNEDKNTPFAICSPRASTHARVGVAIQDDKKEVLPTTPLSSAPHSTPVSSAKPSSNSDLSPPFYMYDSPLSSPTLFNMESRIPKDVNNPKILEQNGRAPSITCILGSTQA